MCARRFNDDRLVPFDEVEWAPDGPVGRVRAVDVDGSRWAIVEYTPGGAREEWCHDGHAGHVLTGAIEYEFEDGAPPLRANEGQSFVLSTGGAGHRGRNVASRPTRLFLIDEAASATS
jgi:hypothetical protein